ncbi:MAG: bifunctional phosphoribosylaminoimidazolecarboxamide formyltransferase/IMP cyclohydrolase [Treponema sp. GWB1_62_6]|nr:MAG: bifunctional phosphoribosylaminoimidazolecarboxamide formyltransferase/IMP cyclohydrolase [Treponema sp. GWC1_61_84]OHE67892.1 MAG: bifunctional phosphoribosylaminoimidazolecarboxamide formyltransferase/IMP cyclohydrolase [Treponema sp. GWB1_62_6]
MKKRALISVFDKEGILDLASYLVGAGWELLSTGGTAKHLKENGLAVTDVSAVTGFPECLDGRVKTLHPAVHAGLLARRSDKAHMETLAKLGLGTIDLVCVNLYPFFEKVQAGLSLEDTVEFIDIGGPTMLRSAAKNYPDVIVLTDPGDYGATIEGLKAGSVPHDFRKRLAGKVFDLTSAYDAAVARYLLDEEFPVFWPMSLKKAQSLRYGENGHQSAALYYAADSVGALGSMVQLQGKELSYNNIRDLDLAWKCACSFGLPSAGFAAFGAADEARILEEAGVTADVPSVAAPSVAVVAVKHNTPCGVAVAPTVLAAYEGAYSCDPVSIFGGIVAATAKVDAATAKRLAELFLEIVVAPDFEPEALEIFAAKKNLRVMRASRPPLDTKECIAVDGGLLVQTADRTLLEKWEVVTKAKPAAADLADMLFGMRAVTYVKSNAIVVVKDRTAIGIGGGQTNRIWPTESALARAAAAVETAKAACGDGTPARVLASDAFFPFADVVEAAAKAGIKSIVQPGGSMRDKDSIEACDRLGIAMVFTGVRHFKH